MSPCFCYLLRQRVKCRYFEDGVYTILHISSPQKLACTPCVFTQWQICSFHAELTQLWEICLSSGFPISVKSSYTLKAVQVGQGKDSTFCLKLHRWKNTAQVFHHLFTLYRQESLACCSRAWSTTVLQSQSKLERKWIKSPHSSLLKNNHIASGFMSIAALQWRTQSVSNIHC